MIDRKRLFEKYLTLRLSVEKGFDVQRAAEVVEELDVEEEILDAKPLLRRYVECKVRHHGPIGGENAADLVEGFNLGGIVSKTQLMDAIGSLQYKQKKVKVRRPAAEHAGISDRPIRKYVVSRRY